MKSTLNTTLVSKRLYPAFALLVLGLIGFGAAYSWFSWQASKVDALRHATELVDLGEKALNAYFSQIEVAFRLSSQDMLDERSRMDPIVAQSRVSRLKNAHPELVNANLTTLDGVNLISSNLDARLPASVGNIRTFNLSVDALSKGQNLSVGQPLLGPVAKEWVIPLRYAIRDAAGNLRYVLTATLPLSRPQSFWKDATLPAGMALGLLRDDGHLVSRYPVPKSLDLTDIYEKPRTGALIKHLQQKQFPVSGHVEGPSSLDGPNHLIVFRRLSNYPLTFFVTQPIANVRANWWSNVEVPYLLLLLLLAGGYAVFRWMLRTQRAWEAERGDAERTLHELNQNLDRLVTERTAELQENERRYRALLANLQGMAYRCRNDRDWTMEFVSEGVRTLLGIAPEDLASRRIPYNSLIHPDDQERVWQKCQASLSVRRPCQMEYRVRHADGAWRWVWEQSMGVYSDSGGLMFLEGYIADITERKQHEDEVRDLNARLDATLRAIPDLLFELDETGRYHDVWAYDTTLLVAQREDLLGRTVSEKLPPDAAKVVLGAIREAAARGSSRGQQIRLSLSREEFWFELSTALKQGKPGEPSHFIMLSRDITARKRAEAEILKLNAELEQRVAARTVELAQTTNGLRDSTARIRAILETVVDGIITIDGRGIVEMVNPSAERIFGYAAAEVVGQNIKMLMPEPYHSLHDGYLERYRATGEARIIGIGREVVGRRKDGSTFPMELAVSKMQLVDERHFTGIVRDITARKQGEQALVSAKDAAEHANRTKDSFLATMSHEIRTPLGGLMGMLELLSFSPLNREQGETLHAARDSGRSLLRILNDILDWSKIEEGRLELAPQPTSIAQLVAEVANTYAHVASGSSVTLAQQTDARLSPALMCDPLRLSQVLNNFISNAIKFSHRGGRVELRAELIARREGAEQVRFSVQDTGIGIDQDVQQRLFQSYGQGSADTARMYGGTGLGLAICSRLADLMGGRIDLDSAPGRGSTFSITLTLPIAKTVMETTRSPAEIVDAASVRPLVYGVAQAHAPLVLVVDDHPINRKLLVRQLGLLDLRAETAEDGEAALALWRAGHYALVITDCHMPVMDGYALTRAIRALEAAEARPRTPVFAWTANALADEIDNCRAAGMDELLVKPADLAQLKTVLAKWLSSAAEPVPDLTAPSAPHAAAPPAVDVSALKTLVGDNAAIIREFLHDFRASSAAIAAEIRAACQGGQATAAGAAAHKLKSSARAVGAFALGELCEAMEAAGKADDSDALAVLLPRFDTEMAVVEEYLDSLLQAGTSD